MSIEKVRFRSHRKSARERNIGFLLSFDEWWDIWDKSGKWELRGRGKGRYCMSRVGDLGPYAVGNVFIQLFENNVTESNIKRTATQETKEKMSKAHIGITTWNKDKTWSEEYKIEQSARMKVWWANRKRGT